MPPNNVNITILLIDSFGLLQCFSPKLCSIVVLYYFQNNRFIQVCHTVPSLSISNLSNTCSNKINDSFRSLCSRALKLPQITFQQSKHSCASSDGINSFISCINTLRTSRLNDQLYDGFIIKLGVLLYTRIGSTSICKP